MTQQLYIKTDGPIPEDSPFEAGTAYRVNAMEFTRHGWGAWIGEHYVISSECGYLRMPDGTYGTWHFCDTSGNPVPVPWEEAAPQVDYRAHAEALEAENERLRKDAERYRSLRIGDIDDIAVVRGLGAMDYGMSAVIGTYSEEIDGDVLDAAIDAAMKGGGE